MKYYLKKIILSKIYMEEEMRNAYLASGLFFIVGVLIFVIGLDQGWESAKLIIILGSLVGLVGGLGFVKPEIAEVLLQYIINQQRAEEEERKFEQRQNRTNNSSQNKASGKSKIKNDYSKKVINNNYYSNQNKKKSK